MQESFVNCNDPEPLVKGYKFEAGKDVAERVESMVWFIAVDPQESLLGLTGLTARNELSGLCVAQRSRRCGIATALVLFACKYSQKYRKSKDHLWGDVYNYKEHERTFYKVLGFSESAVKGQSDLIRVTFRLTK